MSERMNLKANSLTDVTQDTRDRVKELIARGVSEGEIEKQTAVNDRTVRRWKHELDKTGRIGKPPEVGRYA